MPKTRRSFDASAQLRYQRHEQHHQTPRNMRQRPAADPGLEHALREVHLAADLHESTASPEAPFSRARNGQARVTATLLASMLLGAAAAEGLGAVAPGLTQPRPARRLAQTAPGLRVGLTPAPAPASVPTPAPGPAPARAEVLQLTHTAYDFAPLKRMLGKPSHNATFASSEQGTFTVYGVAEHGHSSTVQSSNLEGDDRTAESALLDFASNVKSVFTPAGAAGLQLLRVRPHARRPEDAVETYTFQKIYRNENGTVVELRDANGEPLTWSLKTLQKRIPGALQEIVSAAQGNLGRSQAAATPAAAHRPMNDSSLSVPYQTSTSLKAWFKARSAPAIAYANDGRPYFVQALPDVAAAAPASGPELTDLPLLAHAPATSPAPSPVQASAHQVALQLAPAPAATLEDLSGQTIISTGVLGEASRPSFLRLIAAHAPHDARVVETAAFTREFRYLDPGTSGTGTPFTAGAEAHPLEAGTYQLRQLAWHGEGVEVRLQGPGDAPIALPLPAFVRAFGAQAVHNLLANALQEPYIPGAYYAAPPSDAKLFDDAPGSVGPHLVRQGQVGDCYFDVVVAGILEQNKDFARSMVRPSANGVPGNIDVRMYNPELNSTEPFTLTVTHKLPLAALQQSATAGAFNGGAEADGIVVSPTGVPQIAVPLLEKAYVRANQLFGWHSNDPGYAGIDGGWPDLAMQMLTGQPATRYPIAANMSDAQLWKHLSQVEKGRLVALTTPLFLNIPGEYGAPGIVSQHAYTVVSTRDGGSLANHTVGLRNPWGEVEPDGQGGINRGGNGEFTLRLPEVRQAYRTVSVGDTP